MFTIWQVSTFGTLMVYGVLVDRRVLLIWLTFIIGYTIMGKLQGGQSVNKKRTKVRLATWDPPTEGNCYVKIEVNLKAVDDFIKLKEKEGVRVTYTAIALKCIGQSFGAQKTKKYHGKIVFGT